jgi:hypothetical protein
MRISLEIVVIAIIILVVAIVVLTIFGGGIGQFGTATDARASCLNQGKWSCETTGILPATWNTVPVFTGSDNVAKTCEALASGCECLRAGDATDIRYTWTCQPQP